MNSKETNVPQPFGKDNIRSCCRIKMSDSVDKKYDYQIAIENGIIFNNYGLLIDVCYVCLMSKDGIYYNNYKTLLNTAVLVPDGESIYKEIHKEGALESGLGYLTTVGELLSKKYCVPRYNWMEHLCCHSKEMQILVGLKDAYDQIGKY